MENQRPEYMRKFDNYMAEGRQFEQQYQQFGEGSSNQSNFELPENRGDLGNQDPFRFPVVHANLRRPKNKKFSQLAGTRADLHSPMRQGNLRFPGISPNSNQRNQAIQANMGILESRADLQIKQHFENLGSHTGYGNQENPGVLESPTRLGIEREPELFGLLQRQENINENQGFPVISGHQGHNAIRYNQRHFEDLHNIWNRGISDIQDIIKDLDDYENRMLSRSLNSRPDISCDDTSTNIVAANAENPQLVVQVNGYQIKIEKTTEPMESEDSLSEEEQEQKSSFIKEETDSVVDNYGSGDCESP